MRALVVSELLPDYRGVSLREMETPVPGEGQVLIRVRAASVNFPDLLQTRGEYQHKPDLPFIAGMEAAGEAVEPGAGFTKGERVVGPARGAFAEYAVVSSPRRVPERFSFSQAAAFGTAYLTAYVSLVRRGQMQPGEWVLVHGAAGGVGLAALDLGKALGGRMIAAGASDKKLAIAAAMHGPEAVVNVTGGFKDRVKAITGGGADIVYDPVGGDVFDQSVRCIAFGGRLLSVGFASGRIPTLPVNLALIKGFSLVGVRAGEYGRRYPEKGRENLDVIWRMAEEGKLTPRVHAELPLERWREAFDLLGERKVVGKAVIVP